MTNKLECAHADTCLSDYWSGHHLPHVQIPVYRGMTLRSVKSAIRSELSQGAVAGSEYSESDAAWHRRAIAAVNRMRLANPRKRRLFDDLEDCDGEDCETVYAFFVFIDGD